MTVVEYVLGIAWLAAVLALLAFGARRSVRWLCPSWSGPVAWLAELVAGVAMLVVATELVGLAGGFTRLGLIAGAATIALAVALVCRRLSPLPATGPPSPRQPAWLVALALAASAATAVVWAVPTLQSLDVGMYRQDSTWYHLTFSADFLQTGYVGGVHFTDPLRLAVWFYPQNSELLHGVGMVAFGTDFLSPLVNLGWMILTLLAAWCAGRPYGAGALAVLGVAILLSSNMMQPQAGNAPSDIPALFFLIATIALLLNAHAASGRDRSPGGRLRLASQAPGALFLAALAAGLAVGTKITLLPAVATLTVALILLSPAAIRRRAAAIWALGSLATGGFWYLRNVIHAGNPLPWVDFGVLPTPSQIPLYPRPPHSVADYAGSPETWVDWFVPALEATLGPLWPAIALAVIAGLAVSLRAREDPLRRALGAMGVVSALAYAFIPITAPGPDGAPYGFGSNLRYLAPAMAVGLLLLALATPVARHESRRRLQTKLLAGTMAATFVAVVVASDSWKLNDVGGAVPFGLALVLAPLAIAALLRRGARPPMLGPVAVALLLGFAFLGYAQEETYARDRYRAALAPPADNPGFRSSPQWRPLQEWGRLQRGERIGIVGPAGAFGQYVFYGNDLSNRIQYIGRRGSHGAYRPIVNCFEWRKAVNAGRFTYLVITPALSLGPASESQESLWTRADPAAELVLNAPPASIFRVRGPLDPRGCANQPQLPVLPVPWGGVGVPGVAPGPVLPPRPPRR